MKKVLLVAYESRFARCGGITAVMNYLPGYLRSAAGLATSVITPFHHRIPETSSLPVRPVGTFNVPFFDESVKVNIYRYDDRWHWYFLDAQDYPLPKVRQIGEKDERFFGGLKHPYDVGSNAANQWAILRRDSLFFGAAVARALRELGADIHWTLVMQDWQAATAALALAGPDRNHNTRLFLTLHNSYDSGRIEPADLLGVGIKPEHVPALEVQSKALNRAIPVSTVLGRAMPLLNKPFFTVSEQFARDFTEDIFQSGVMADHLQDILQSPNLVGVNNGPFTSLAVPEKPELADARRHMYGPLKEWKSKQKTAAVAALAEFTPDEIHPAWGHIANFVAKAKASADMPWFVLAGRDDTRQKGYDVAAEAIRNFLRKPGNDAKAQFLFFPIPGDEGREGLLFLRRLAEDYKANVLVLLFIFHEGYMAALQGAAFGVMPSLYEPFGMANEFYLNGAVGIGRATGGLLQQIVPLRAIPSFTPDVDRRSSRWHPPSVAATGFLYRESDNNPEIVGHWKAFNEVKYLSEPGKDRVAERKKYRLFTDMAGALEQALEDAIEVYSKPPAPDGMQPYYAMLVEGIGHIQRGFSWEWSAAEYNSYLV
ncbi:MAG: glycogen/starch synthase [Isosphaerales bacterium]